MIIMLAAFFGAFFLVRYPYSLLFETDGLMFLAAFITSGAACVILGYMGSKKIALAAENRIISVIPLYSAKYKKELLSAFDEACGLELRGEEFNEFVRGAYTYKVKKKEAYINKMINK